MMQKTMKNLIQNSIDPVRFNFKNYVENGCSLSHDLKNMVASEQMVPSLNAMIDIVTTREGGAKSNGSRYDFNRTLYFDPGICFSFRIWQ